MFLLILSANCMATRGKRIRQDITQIECGCKNISQANHEGLCRKFSYVDDVRRVTPIREGDWAVEG